MDDSSSDKIAGLEIKTVVQETNKTVSNEDDTVFTNLLSPDTRKFQEKISATSDTAQILNYQNNPQTFSSIKEDVTQKLQNLTHKTVDSVFSQPSTSKQNFRMEDDICLKKRVELYAPDTGPQMYMLKGDLVTRPIITKNLPQVFQYLPIYGKPGPDVNLETFHRNKVREFVGCDINDDEFNELENYCSPEHLKTGKELKMFSTVPHLGVATGLLPNKSSSDMGEEPNLVTLKRNDIRIKQDVKGAFTKKLKYRGVRIIPVSQEVKVKSNISDGDEELSPGVDILYRVRVYRCFSYSMIKERYTRCRHSVFDHDIVLSGRNKLSDLRDRFVCYNDFDMRVDVSEHPDIVPVAKAKDLFPSGFLFINNVFYVDTREGCKDYSAPIREWAIKKKIGEFPKKDMCQVRLHDLVLKLGYPEVYVHQGNCEHLFIFSEVRLLSATDPLRSSSYPLSTTLCQNQTVYCTTCAEFSAKWIVVGSERVPFDPGFFCDTCFKSYMYKDGVKIGQFKAYRYRGNALNVLKP